MELVFTHMEHDRYADSLEILFAATVLNGQPGISQGYIGMAGDSFRETLREAGSDYSLENVAAAWERILDSLETAPVRTRELVWFDALRLRDRLRHGMKRLRELGWQTPRYLSE